MDFIEYETKKYKLYRSMKRKHIRSFRQLNSASVTGAFNIQRKNGDISKLKKLIEKYKRKIKYMEQSDYGDIIVLNYDSSVKKLV